MLTKIRMILFLFLLAGAVKAQESANHWMPPIRLDGPYNVGSDVQRSQLLVTTRSATPVNVNVYQGSSTTPLLTFTVDNTASHLENLAFGDGSPIIMNNNEFGIVRTDEGLRVEADGLVGVSVRYLSAGVNHAEVIVSKGSASLGTTFRAGGIPLGMGAATDIAANMFSIMATEDNTTLDLSNFPVGVRFENLNGGAALPAGFTHSVTLNAGEVFGVTYALNQQITSETNKILGVLIESDHPVVVNTGYVGESIRNANSNAADYGLDQIVGVDRLGTEFVMSRASVGGWSNLYEIPVVVAHTNNTSVFVNGGITPVATLQAGEYFLLDGAGSDDINTTDYTARENMHVRTTNPAYVFQNMTGNNGLTDPSGRQGEPQQGMFFVPPFICAAPRVGIVPRIDEIVTLTANGGLNIVTKSTGELTINGTPLATYLAAGTLTNYGTNDINGHYIDGSTNYVSYKIQGTALTGDIVVESTEDLYLAGYGFNGVAGFGGFYSGFEPEIFLEIDNVACLPQVLDVGDDLFDSYRWYLNNVQIVNASGTTYTVQEPGNYFVIGVLEDCSEVRSNMISIAAVDIPTGTTPQHLCAADTPTIADLLVDDLVPSQIAKNYSVVWYPDQVEIDPAETLPDPAGRLPLTTPLQDATSYFAAFVEHDALGNEMCESARRFEVYVIFDTLPNAPTVPVGEETQEFCANPTPTINDLQATPASGFELAWFDQPSGGARLPGITPLANGVTYYAESFDPDISCENTNRTPVLVNLEGPITITNHIDDLTICHGGNATFTVAANSGAGGTLTYQWQQSSNGTTWTTIAGATGASYTRNAVNATTDNGMQIRVNVSTPACATIQQSYATLTVEGPVTITNQPSNVTVCANGTATFNVGVTSGQGILSYVWEESIDNGLNWQTVGTNASLVRSPVSAAQNGNRYRVKVKTGACNEVISAEAVMTVEGPVVINSAPANQTVCAGQNATFSVVAEAGVGTPSYTWEQSTNGGASWTTIAGATTASYTKTGVTSADNGTRYRVNVTSGACNAPARAIATLTVEGPITITSQPANVTACANGSAVFSVTATAGGSGTLSYQWEESADNGATWNVVGTSSTYVKSPVSDAQNGNRYRVKVSTGACNEIISNAAVLTVEGPVVINTPLVNQTVCAGGSATFSVAAEAGTGTPAYRWEESTDNGATWSLLAGETGTSYTKTGVTAADNGNRYRVSVTSGACGTPVRSSAILTVEGPVVITSQPVNVVTCANGSATFSVTATSGVGTLSYQWEESADNGATWNVVGTSSTHVKSPVTASQNGNRYRVKVRTGACNEIISNAAVLTVEGPVVITTPLVNQTVCAGGSTTFSVVAEAGVGTPAYRWEESTDNGATWSLISGETSSSYTKSGITVADNGNRYRVSVTSGACAAPVQSSAILTVEGPVTITAQPANTTVCANGTAVFSVTANGGSGTLSYEWQESSDNGATWNTVGINSTYSKSPVSDAQNGNLYRVKVKTGACNEVISNTALLTVEGPVNITTAVQNQTTCAGSDVTFSVVADAGAGTPAYVWQESADSGATWTVIAGETGASYTKTGVTASDNNHRYRVSVTTGSCGSAVTSTGILRVEGPVVITSHPSDVIACANGSAVFNVTASAGNGTLSYEWEESIDNGISWNTVATSATLVKSPVSASQHGNQYRVKVRTATCGEVISNVATLTVEGPVTFTQSLTNRTVCTGEDVQFSVAVDAGIGTPAYAWQESIDNGATWTTIAGETTSTYTKTAITMADSGNRYRVLVTTGACSNPAVSTSIITVADSMVVTSQPEDVLTCEGEIAIFSVSATSGNTSISYFWEESIDNGATWQVVGTSDTYIKSPADAIHNGNKYRVRMTTGLCGEVISDEVTLTVEGAIEIDPRLDDQTVCAGEDAVFAVRVVAGSGTPFYQWQESADNGATWTTIAGETQDTYIRTNTTESDHGKLFRVNVTTPGCTNAVSSSALLRVEGPVVITQQPQDITACADGGAAIFTVQATAAHGTLKYQWEASLDGGNTWEIVGNDKIYSRSPLTAGSNGQKFRVKVSTGVCNQIVSDEVTLNVAGPVEITTGLEDAIVCANEDATFNVTAITEIGTLFYQWEESIDNGITWNTIGSATGSSYTLSGVTLADNGKLIRVSVGAQGCNKLERSVATLNVERGITIVKQPEDITACQDQMAVFDIEIDADPSQELSYLWEASTDGGNTWDTVGQFRTLSVFAAADADGTLYRVSVNNGVCAEVFSDEAALFVQPSAQIYEQPEDVEAEAGQSVTFEVVMVYESGTYTYQWQEYNGTTWRDLTEDGTYVGVHTAILTVNNVNQTLDENRYRVRIDGCNESILSDFGVLNLNNESFPNMFSPNGDGINETFMVPYLRDYPNFTMEIYDRWGNLVHKIVDDGNTGTEPNWWDGRSNGRMNYNDGEILPSGTYYYVVHFNRENTKAPKTGWVYLRK